MRFGDLRKQLEDIRRSGYATNSGEWREQVVGAAAPIRDASGQVVAALGISGPADRLPKELLDKSGLRLIEVTEVVSRRLGYSRM